MIRNALIVSPIPFQPDWEGNRKRVGQMVSLLMHLGFRVHFLHVMHDLGSASDMASRINGTFHSLPDKKRAHSLQPWLLRLRFAKLFRLYEMCNFDVDSWYFDQIGSVVEQLIEAEKIEVVVCEYIFYTKFFDRLHGVLKIIDTHDVFADRYKMFLAMGRRPQWFSTSIDGERQALARADIVLAIQDGDADHFRSLGSSHVITLPYIPEIQPFQRKRDASPLLRLCFVGSNVDVNQSAIDFILRLVIPGLIEASLPFHLVVVGQICSYEPLSPDIPHVSKLGQVADLGEVLAAQDAMINPSAAGSGLPIKVMEALAHGLHVIGTAAGVRGVPCLSQLSTVVSCESKEEWVKICRDLLVKKQKIDIAQAAIQDYSILQQYLSERKRLLRSALNQCSRKHRLNQFFDT